MIHAKDRRAQRYDILLFGNDHHYVSILKGRGATRHQHLVSSPEQYQQGRLG
jgi:hypothetical protein